MKLLYTFCDRHQLRASRKRFLRGRRARGATTDSKVVRVVAPSLIDIYTRRSHGVTCGFVREMRSSARPGVTLLICFRNTVKITAAAGLVLLAEVDSLLRLTRNLKIDCALPAARVSGSYKNADMVVESVLQRIGFLKLIGKKGRITPRYAHVQCWDALIGDTADGSLAGKLLKQVEESGKISDRARRRLYRGAFEAIANCVDHAYPNLAGGSKSPENRWWMFVSLLDSELVVLVYDLGVGIPATLPSKHPETVLEKIFSLLGLTERSDGDLIRAATYIKRTRTEQDHRGKGGSDLRSLIEHYPEGALSIYSSSGSFHAIGKDRHIKRRAGRRLLQKLGAQLEVSDNYQDSLRGTLVEWSIPVEALEKNAG